VCLSSACASDDEDIAARLDGLELGRGETHLLARIRVSEGCVRRNVLLQPPFRETVWGDRGNQIVAREAKPKPGPSKSRALSGLTLTPQQPLVKIKVVVGDSP
jgi:hypothetical protein